MIEIKENAGEEVILKLITTLEKKVKNNEGLNPEEVKHFYNRLLHDVFTGEKLIEHQDK